MRAVLLSAISALAISASAQAGPDDFGPGPLVRGYGEIAEIDNEMPIPEGSEFRIRYDVARGADAGARNRTLTTAARFLNMHAAAGVPAENLHVAVVVHGSAVRDVSGDRVFQGHHGDAAENANAALIAELSRHGVEIYVCGQSAAYYDVENEDLLPGVTMALSAMTAHLLLEADGYTLNPF